MEGQELWYFLFDARHHALLLLLLAMFGYGWLYVVSYTWLSVVIIVVIGRCM